MTTTANRLDVQAINPTIGGTISGQNFPRDLHPEEADELRRALLERKVLFLKRADLNEEEFEGLARQFGELLDHPTLPKLPNNVFINPLDSDHGAEGTSRWHFGGPWREDPFVVELLQLKVVPPAGGDTAWADLGAAYEALSGPIRSLVDGLTATYISNPAQYSPTTQSEGFDPLQRVRHPLVIAHPETGRRSLYLHSGIAELEELTPAESQALLSYLFTHASAQRFVVRHRWESGDIAIWDNRAVWHAAVNDYGSEKRYGWHISVIDPKWRPSRR